MVTVRRVPIAFILALTVLLSSLFTAQAATAAWFCEGQICSTSVLGCCCASPTPAGRDPRWGPLSGSRADTTLCAADCGCDMVITAATEQPTGMVPAAAHFVPPLALLPAPFVLRAAPQTVAQTVPAADSRGPPTASIALVTPSLRAPPHA